MCGYSAEVEMRRSEGEGRNSGNSRKRPERLDKRSEPAVRRRAYGRISGNADGWEGSFGQVLRDAGGRLGISPILMLPQAGLPRRLSASSLRWGQQRPDAVLVSGEGDLYAHRQLIVELAEKSRLPTMCPTEVDFIGSLVMTSFCTELHFGHSNWRCSKPIGPGLVRASIMREVQREQRGRSMGESVN